MQVLVPNQTDPVQVPIYEGDLDGAPDVLPDGHYRMVDVATSGNLSVLIKDGVVDEVMPIL